VPVESHGSLSESVVLVVVIHLNVIEDSCWLSKLQTEVALGVFKLGSNWSTSNLAHLVDIGSEVREETSILRGAVTSCDLLWQTVVSQGILITNCLGCLICINYQISVVIDRVSQLHVWTVEIQLELCNLVQLIPLEATGLRSDLTVLDGRVSCCRSVVASVGDDTSEFPVLEVRGIGWRSVSSISVGVEPDSRVRAIEVCFKVFAWLQVAASEPVHVGSGLGAR